MRRGTPSPPGRGFSERAGDVDRLEPLPHAGMGRRRLFSWREWEGGAAGNGPPRGTRPPLPVTAQSRVVMVVGDVMVQSERARYGPTAPRRAAGLWVVYR